MNFKATINGIFFLTVLILIPERSFSVIQETRRKNYIFYTVKRVIDGDTFWAEDSFASLFARLARKARNEEKGLWGEMRKSNLQRSKGKRLLR